MKHIAITTPLMLSALVWIGSARAQSTARVELNGSIDAGTCAVASVARTLPSVSADVFPQSADGEAGADGSYTNFDIALTGCAGVTGATFQMGTTSDASTQQYIFRNKAVDGAPYVGYWIRHGEGRCAAGTTVAPGASLSRAFNTATYSLPLCAQYHKIPGGIVTAGPVTTTFTVTVTYR